MMSGTEKLEVSPPRHREPIIKVFGLVHYLSQDNHEVKGQANIVYR